MKNPLLCCLVSSLLTVMITAQANAPVTELNPVSAAYGYYYTSPSVSAGGDYIIFTHVYPTAPIATIRILKRTDSGFYEPVYGLNQTSYFYPVHTNGDWFVIGTGITVGDYYLFQLAGDGSVINADTLPRPANSQAMFLDDNSFIIFVASNITTYRYTNGQWTITDETLVTDVTFNNPFHLNGNFLAGIDTTGRELHLFSRQNDDSWQFGESFSYNVSQYMTPSDIIWNSQNMVLVADSGLLRTYLFEKNTTNDWNLMLTTNYLGAVTPPERWARDIALIDPDTVVIGASYDGVLPLVNAGSAYVLHRENGVWNYTHRYQASANNTMGLAVKSNAHDMVLYACGGHTIPELHCMFYSVPLNALVAPSSSPTDGQNPNTPSASSTNPQAINSPNQVSTPRATPSTTSSSTKYIVELLALFVVLLVALV